MPDSLLTGAAVRLAEPVPSAGGSPLDQLLVVSAFTLAAYAVLAWVILRERQGRPTAVGRLADRVAALDGGPRWFALPALVSVTGALSGAFGVYWDVSYHITEGRDEGPLANPSHYLIFLGLLAMFAGGALGMALADDRLPRRTLRVTRAWRTPLGPATVTGIALCALAGFPLDDVWHRLFGQDVTEWGPTHVLMIGGAVLLPVALLLSAAEARQVSGSRLAPLLTFVSHSYLLIGPVAFLLEYAFGVPQFPLVMDVVVMTVGVAAALVLASYRGAGFVLGVWAFYVVVQLLLMASNVLLLDVLSPRFPLLVGGALAAALLARLARPTWQYGALAGAVVGGAAVLLEAPFTHAFRPVEWPTAMLPWAVLLAVATGAGTGVVATWMHRALQRVGTPDGAPGSPADPAGGTGGRAALAGLLVVVAVFAWNVPPREDLDVRAEVTLTPVEDGRALLAVRLEEDLAEGAWWFESLSWQGGGLVRSDLERVGPGEYRTADPVPVAGDWKTILRLHQPLHQMVAAPVYLPADPAIPAPEFPAESGPRDFVPEHQLLQRETKDDVPGWLWATGYVTVGLVFVVLLAVIAVGYTLAAGAGRRAVALPRPTSLTGAR